MAQSMTGFGMAEGDVQDGRLRVEVRSVNHRHLSPSIKLADELQPLESAFRDALRSRFGRGHVTLTARWNERPSQATSVHVNVDRAREVLAAIRELQTALSLNGDIDITFVAKHPDVLATREDAPASITWEEVSPIVDEALSAAGAVRAREGAALGQELGAILIAMNLHVEGIQALAPQRLEREHLRLREAVERLASGISADDVRIAQELAIAADRLDISEELVRLGAHFDAARNTLGRAGPIGKELGFLAQELLREVNTIGSKANDVDITKLVIALKGEIEKFREQLENIE